MKYKPFKIFSIVGFFAVVGLSYINLNTYISGVQVKEYNILKDAVNDIPLDKNRDIIFIIPERNFLTNEGFYEKSYLGEFVQVSSSRLWFARPFLLQNLKETRKIPATDIEPYTIEVYPHDETFKAKENAQIINLRTILEDGFSNLKTIDEK